MTTHIRTIAFDDIATCPTCGAQSSNTTTAGEMDEIERRHPPSKPVLQDWVMGMNWKQQSILLSSLRGPDVPNVPNIKIVNRWMRSQCQHNADTSKNYMAQKNLPMPLLLCEELEFLPCHYVHHFADGLAVLAYNHPDIDISLTAAEYHYRIAEELFHFEPELPGWFILRHQDRPDPDAPHPFTVLSDGALKQYMDLVRTLNNERHNTV